MPYEHLYTCDVNGCGEQIKLPRAAIGDTPPGWAHVVLSARPNETNQTHYSAHLICPKHTPAKLAPTLFPGEPA